MPSHLIQRALVAFVSIVAAGGVTPSTSWASARGESPLAVPNEPPIAVDDAYRTPQDVALHVPAPGVLDNDSDPDGDSFVLFTVPDGVDHGLLQISQAGSFAYTPDPGFAGTDAFSYTIVDAEGNDNTAAVTITVTPTGAPTTTAPVTTSPPATTPGTTNAPTIPADQSAEPPTGSDDAPGPDVTVGIEGGATTPSDTTLPGATDDQTTTPSASAVQTLPVTGQGLRLLAAAAVLTALGAGTMAIAKRRRPT